MMMTEVAMIVTVMTKVTMIVMMTEVTMIVIVLPTGEGFGVRPN
jgi:hypothetical protein